MQTLKKNKKLEINLDNIKNDTRPTSIHTSATHIHNLKHIQGQKKVLNESKTLKKSKVKFKKNNL